ncbi:RICIN domain-containing protein [Streptomyces orinoci]|uniref:RICIN domain-containing protein n=1 Tax=Streptomyces orinoci TaxID=67339 RepID=A0ABV3JRW4_STRON|nr:RICIN domain-containing protein [Streptomyces orinoci]
MAGLIRFALIFGVGAAALAGSTVTAHAEGGVPLSAAPAEETIVQLKVTHSGKCLDIPQARTENGVHAWQWECNGSAAQRWRVVPMDNSSFQLRLVASDKCLEVENSGRQEGAVVQQWACTNGQQMRWRAVLVDPVRKLFELRPAHVEDRCLDIANSMTENGAPAWQWACNQTNTQLWQILEVK